MHMLGRRVWFGGTAISWHVQGCGLDTTQSWRPQKMYQTNEKKPKKVVSQEHLSGVIGYSMFCSRHI